MDEQKQDDRLLKKSDNADCKTNYSDRIKWYPNRRYAVTGRVAVTDALADESLYKASDVGTVESDVQKVKADSIGRFTVLYRTGNRSIQTGDTIGLYIRGQKTLGDGPVDVRVPNHCSIEQIKEPFALIACRVTKGALHFKDTIEFRVGGEQGFRFTKLADRYEIKVIIKPASRSATMRPPIPVVLCVMPLKPDTLEITLPATRRDDMLQVHATVRDAFDNRVPLSGEAVFSTPSKTMTVPVENGIANTRMPYHGSSMRTVHGRIKPWNISGCSHPNIDPINGYHLYFGDLHCHDFLSEAWGYPDQVYEWAIRERRLDFLSVSLQSHGWPDNDKWTIMKLMAERYLDEGRFVTFLANEWQHTAYGDKVIHFLNVDRPFFCALDERYDTPQKLYDVLRKTDALVISHHLAYKKNGWCPAVDFDCIEIDVERLVEIWSMHGSSEGFDENDRPLVNGDPTNSAMACLRKGLKVGFTAGSDTHSGRPGGSAREPRPYWGGLTGVWARSLTRADLFEALFARRTFAIERDRITMMMTVNKAVMGSQIPFCKKAEIVIQVWAPYGIKQVQILKNTELYRMYGPFDTTCDLRLEDQVDEPCFYHARVVCENGSHAVCSPVWIEKTT